MNRLLMGLALVLFVSLGCNRVAESPPATAKKEVLKELVAKNGKRFVWTEVDGKKEGVERVFFPDGRLHRETEYKGDKRNGKGRAYWEDGSLQFVAEYKDDVEVSGDSWDIGVHQEPSPK